MRDDLIFEDEFNLDIQLDKKRKVQYEPKELTLSSKRSLDRQLLARYRFLKNFYKNIYGFGFHRLSIFRSRFEKKKIQSVIDKPVHKLIILKLIRSFLPYNKDIRRRRQAFLCRQFILKTYRSFRHLAGLPVRGQRTWSNANTVKRSNVELRQIFAARAWKKYPFLTKTYANTAALAEFSNFLFHINWLSEWIYANSQIEEARSNNNIVKVDLYAMSRFFSRVEFGDYKISKKTKQKKKIVKQAGYTTGLTTGFAYVYLRKSARELRHTFLQFYYTKTKRMIQEKENKKKKKDKYMLKEQKV